MTEDKEARLKEIEKELDTWKKYPGTQAVNFLMPVQRNHEWVITELKSAWEREKILIEALKEYRDLTGVLVDSGIVKGWVDDLGLAAREALAKVEQVK